MEQQYVLIYHNIDDSDAGHYLGFKKIKKEHFSKVTFVTYEDCCGYPRWEYKAPTEILEELTSEELKELAPYSQFGNIVAFTTPLNMVDCAEEYNLYN